MRVTRQHNQSRDEYVDMIRPWVTTSTVESSFALLKCGLMRSFHSLSEQHLQRYTFDFRWNYRIKTGYNDVQRQQVILTIIAGKRLTYHA